MASRALLQLLTFSIIFKNQFEARSYNKTHDLEKTDQYDITTTPVNKRPDINENANDGYSTVIIKKKYSQFDQHSDTNAESRNNILSRNKYDGKYKNKDYEEANSDKSQAELQSDDYLQSNAKITSNIYELTSSDNGKHVSNEVTCSKETKQVNKIKRKLVTKVVTQTVAIEKVKKEDGIKLETNDGSLHNDVEKDHPTVKPVRIHKQLTVNTDSRTTQATREKQIIPKITHKRYAEAKNEICKTKHCDYKNHRSIEKISRDRDAYKFKRRHEFKTASKGNHKNKYKNNMKIKHHHNKSHRKLKTQPQENGQNTFKHRDIVKRLSSNKMSLENDIYVRKHIDDFATVDETVTYDYLQKQIDDSTSVEEPVSKQENLKYKQKYSNNFQKKRQLDKTVKKVRHADKTKKNSKKHNSKKNISSQKKYKLAPKKVRDFVFETHTDLSKGDNETNAYSGDTLNPNDADTPTIENQDEEETIEKYEEQLKQNYLLKKLKLPFYVSSTTTRVIKEISKKQLKKPTAHRNKKKTDTLLDDLNTVLKWDSDSINQNIDLNTTISRLTSSKILDFITDRLASEMLKKMEKSLAPKDQLRTKEMNPKKVEQIEILLKNDGGMVMVEREHVQEKENDSGFREY